MPKLLLPPDFSLPAMDCNVADRDTMYDGNDEHYLSVGLSALACIKAALAGREPKRILDLPCGFGRVTRLLRAAYPSAQITVCDLDRESVDFAASTFDAQPIYSAEDLSELRLDRSYNLIWVGSLTTHLSEQQTLALLDVLRNYTTIGSTVVISSHGPSIASRLRQWGYGLEPSAVADIFDDYREQGYGHRGYGGVSGYGISLTDQSWWRQAVEPNLFKIVYYLERAWDNHQDIVVLRRVSRFARNVKSLLNAKKKSRPNTEADVQMRRNVSTYDAEARLFDSGYYLTQNLDVADAVAKGYFESAFEHYVRNGRSEGRAPRRTP